MSHAFASQPIRLITVFVAIGVVACAQVESDDNSKSAAGGTDTTTEQGAGAGGTSGGAASGGTTGGSAPVSTGESGAAGAASASSGGASGGGATLAQCPAEPRRDITVRVVYPDGMTEPSPSSLRFGDATTNRIEGTLQSIAELTEVCPTCSSGTRQVVGIPLVDDQARTFTLVAYPVELVSEWVAAATPLVGQRLSLMFRYARGFQYSLSTGFVLSDAVGPVIVAEQAQYVTALASADLPGFDVVLGEPICEVAGVCATNVYQSLVFTGTTSATAGLIEDATFTIGSQSYKARNLGAGSLGATTCVDLERASPWSMWRVGS